MANPRAFIDALRARPLQRNLWPLLALLAVLAFSFAWVWRAGHRGLFMLDESIVFDGAWRISQGQVPYRDFLMPFGPVTFALQALVFRLVGVDFSALVLGAALLSLLATSAALRLLWLLSARSPVPTLCGGLLVAVWYQAPFGVPWMEQTAFFFDLVSLLAIVEARLRPRSSELWYVLAGLASALAVLSKQNAGALFVPVCLGCVWLPWRGRARRAARAALLYLAGGVAAGLVFCAWLAVFSNVPNFVHYWLELSSTLAWGRIEYWKVWGTFFFQGLIAGSIPLFVISSLAGALTLLFALSARGASVTCESVLAAWLCLALPQFHSVFQLTTNNDAANNNAFVGVVVACAFELVRRAGLSQLALSAGAGPTGFEQEGPRRLLRVTRVALVACALYSLGEGLMIAENRNVQEFFGARFTRTLDIPRASSLVWGEPTRITPQFCPTLGEMCKIASSSVEFDRKYEILRQEDFERIEHTLEQRQEAFFVFPDATILYGLVGKPSPQPLLYFHPGQSFFVADEAKLDREIVTALERHRVRLVVLERASFMGTQRLLDELPSLRSWLAENFRVADEFGNYRLLEARVPRPSEPVSLAERALRATPSDAP